MNKYQVLSQKYVQLILLYLYHPCLPIERLVRVGAVTMSILVIPIVVKSLRRVALRHVQIGKKIGGIPTRLHPTLIRGYRGGQHRR